MPWPAFSQFEKEGEEDEEEEEPEWKGGQLGVSGEAPEQVPALTDLSGSGLSEKALCPESERITAESFAAWKATGAPFAVGHGNHFWLAGPFLLSRDELLGRRSHST